MDNNALLCQICRLEERLSSLQGEVDYLKSDRKILLNQLTELAYFIEKIAVSNEEE